MTGFELHDSLGLLCCLWPATRPAPAHRRALLGTCDVPPHLTWPVGGLTIRYLGSLLYPEEAVVECAPLALGRTSFTLGYGIFRGDTCTTVAHSQTICLDPHAGRSVPLPGDVVEELTRQMNAAGFGSPG